MGCSSTVVSPLTSGGNGFWIRVPTTVIVTFTTDEVAIAPPLLVATAVKVYEPAFKVGVMVKGAVLATPRDCAALKNSTLLMVPPGTVASAVIVRFVGPGNDELL